MRRPWVCQAFVAVTRPLPVRVDITSKVAAEPCDVVLITSWLCTALASMMPPEALIVRLRGGQACSSLR